MADALYGGEYAVYRGEDRTIPFAPATPTSISGQTHEVRIIDPLGNDSTVTIADGSLTKTTATGEIVATLTQAITAAFTANKYAVELWRNDSSHRGKIGWIFINVQN
jgi:hypothetical protein